MTIRKEYKLTFCHDPSDSEQAKQFPEFTRIFILKNQPQIAPTFLIYTIKIIRDNSGNSWQTF
jgi:hypothetical protein